MTENQNEQINLTDLEPSEEVKGGGTLSKVGPGTLVLTNANTYTGQTSVNNGAALQIQGEITVSKESL